MNTNKATNPNMYLRAYLDLEYGERETAEQQVHDKAWDNAQALFDYNIRDSSGLDSKLKQGLLAGENMVAMLCNEAFINGYIIGKRAKE